MLSSRFAAMFSFHLFVTASARFFTPAAQSAMQMPVEQAKQLFPAAPRGAHVRPSPLSSARFSVCVSPVATGLLPFGLSLILVAVAGTRGLRLASVVPRRIFRTHEPGLRRTGACICGASADLLVEQLGATRALTLGGRSVLCMIQVRPTDPRPMDPPRDQFRK